jgi:N,N'-diacetyllegionaminate synthase
VSVRVLAVIPARGGSRSIPRKNLQMVAGRPLLAWTIDAALRARAVERVVVSTDDEEIARVAREWGAEVPVMRPADLARDDTPGIDPVIHMVSWLSDRERYEPDVVAILQPTSPLRPARDIDAAVSLYRDRGVKALNSVYRESHPASWTSPMGSDGVLTAFRPELEEPAVRQEDAGRYAQDGAIYLIDRAHLLANRTLYADPTIAYVMPADRALDIDEPWQLTVADALLSRRHTARDVTIGGRRLGAGQPVLVVAEIGVNHNGRLDLAAELVDAAAAAGADAVKFQTWKTDELVTRDAPVAEYQGRAAAAKTQYDLLRALELDESALRELKQRAERRGLLFFSTPDEETSADLLERLDVPAFKIGSGELTNVRLLRHVAAKGKPLMLSTGMATTAEVAEAVRAIEAAGNSALVLMHCVSAYPSPVDESNLEAMETLRSAFGCPVGFSDHTMAVETASAAVAKGAAVIEKHITLDRSLPGPDHQASFDVPQFRAMVEAIRRVESSLGDGVKRPMPCELPNRGVVRKVLVAARAMRAGDVLGEQDVAFRRAPAGLALSEIGRVVGRTLRCDVDRDTPITAQIIDGL